MFQAFDNPGPDRPLGRSQWMALLARAPLGLLESALHAHATRPARWLRAPETGLMMVQGRAGGTGERFNLGEVTVTRCALRVADASDATEATVGVAYVLGRSHRQVQLAALADALLQDPAQQPVLDAQLLEPIRTHLRTTDAAQRDDLHQYVPIPFVRGLLPDAVLEPIRLHVDAKRYLCAMEPSYWATLSPASQHSLVLQGGPFTPDEAMRFAAQPFAQEALRLRRYDDLAKVPGLPTPPLDHYMALLQSLALAGAAAGVAAPVAAAA